jgi:curli biogenesis system outer membrane secretion channel CsgG
MVLLASGCTLPNEMFGRRDANLALVEGPPIADVQTGFDDALSCMRGEIPKEVIFAVGQVVDSTGKENYSEGGAGKYVTQGAGEMVQSALFRAGVSVVNRRDSSITINEANWGIRDIKRQVPVNFYISGSINSLDFIPGGGGEATIAGIGPRYRESRILIALDLSMTDAYTGRVVASVPLQKQIFTSESGIGINTFFGSTLVQLDAGGMQREALHFALRQMLNLASFELLGQIIPRDVYTGCHAHIGEGVGEISNVGPADTGALARAIEETKTPPAPPATIGPAPAGAAAGSSAPAPVTRSRGDLLGEQANKAATLAIKAAHESEAAADRKTAVAKAAESLQLANLALRALKEAAAAGFAGEEGEVAAVVVQQALQAAQRAGTAAAARAAEEQPPAAEEQGPPAAEPAPAASTATTVAPASAADAAAATEAEAKPGGAAIR